MLSDQVKRFAPGAPSHKFNEMKRTFPLDRFEDLHRQGFPFYKTTFWYPLDREPQNVFESVVASLKELADPAPNVIGVEWWFSVMSTNTTPQWLLSCHFDRNDLAEKDLDKTTYPSKSSVLFLNSVPYGELVITDQIQTAEGIRPKQPGGMAFVRPRKNMYAVFPGQLYHGVIGRMWRPMKENHLRVSLAVNWWIARPKAGYLRDSKECLSVFGLDK